MPLLCKKEDFDRFSRVHSTVWPYNCVRLTRNRFSPSVVVLLAADGAPSMVRATSFNEDTLQHLLTTGQCVPAAPSFAGALICMDKKGKRESVKWFDRVVKFCCRRLICGQDLSDEHLFVQCLKCWVSERLGNSQAARAMQLELVEQWVFDTLEQCECHGNRDVESLATCTFGYINACIEACVLPLSPISSTGPTLVSP